MVSIRLVLMLALSLGLGACGASDTATRSAPPASFDSLVALQVAAPRYTVVAVQVSVPRDLSVSEANRFYPVADIVWRGEPIADRHLQVKAILDEAASAATAPMRSGPEIMVEIDLVRFHSLTEKTRYTVGGVHSLRFDLTLRDAATGAVIDGPRRVVADVRGTGGAQAIADDARGRTQRVVIVERLTQVITRELTLPLADDAVVQSERGPHSGVGTSLR